MSSIDGRQVRLVLRQPYDTSSAPGSSFTSRLHDTGIGPFVGALWSAYVASPNDATVNPFNRASRSPGFSPTLAAAESAATALTRSPASVSSVRPTFSGNGYTQTLVRSHFP